ncbi:MAG TPA: tRNA pseudouridine(55) synthase TruB [Acidimicrobiales bacterium]|nr:tRNA pseudouridine(55) synthase TruB [Acidimicrobiales bacterium]
MGLDGWLPVDKPAGWTSHDVVARCRRQLGERRVGHGGTLDPDATGLLLVGVGRATRLLRFLTALPKAYEGELVLGTATSTLDASGEVTGTWDMSSVGAAEVAAAAERLTGPQQQIPPMVSAVQVGGRRLHELAREGRTVDRPARAVVVERFTVSPVDGPLYRFEVHCSSGTYVRTLVDDLGRALGGGAHLRRLRRVATGPFQVSDAVPLESVGPEAVRPAVGAVAFLGRVVVDGPERADVGHGRRLSRVALGERGAPPEGPGPWAVVDTEGNLLAVYEADAGADDLLRAAVVLAPA